MSDSGDLFLSAPERAALWRLTGEAIDAYLAGVTSLPVAADVDRQAVQDLLSSFAVAGWSGYERAIRRQVEFGQVLRAELAGAHWPLLNDTLLPLACFTERLEAQESDEARLRTIANEVVQNGDAWINVVKLPTGRAALRACIANMTSDEGDIRRLISALQRARALIA